MNTVINSWGNSLAVRLPSDIINSMKLKQGDILKIIEKNNEIILKTESKKKISLKERLKNFNGIYDFKEVEWGEPVGNEVW
ncbi:MAG: AbrB/MazE/SpoVT family DNA-binding domain-containing protein [Novosphingobium sp.]|nr:AbrB/MazE/SpoVT family DNA-binding domain-containing protein [Novosphingobium sp.]